MGLGYRLGEFGHLPLGTIPKRRELCPALRARVGGRLLDHLSSELLGDATDFIGCSMFERTAPWTRRRA